jgi:hypothetical protein
LSHLFNGAGALSARINTRWESDSRRQLVDLDPFGSFDATFPSPGEKIRFSNGFFSGSFLISIYTYQS